MGRRAGLEDSPSSIPLHRAGPAVRTEQFHGGGQDVEHEDPMHFDGAEQQSMQHGGRTTVK
jgi:hypothetical protein